VGTVVHGGSYIVVAISPTDLISASAPQMCWPFFRKVIQFWRDLELRNNDGRLEDSVSYGTDGDWPVGPDGLAYPCQSGPKYGQRPRGKLGRRAHRLRHSGAANFPSINAPADQSLVFNETSAHERHLLAGTFNDGTNNLRWMVMWSRSGEHECGLRVSVRPESWRGSILALDQAQLSFKPNPATGFSYMLPCGIGCLMQSCERQAAGAVRRMERDNGGIRINPRQDHRTVSLFIRKL